MIDQDRALAAQFQLEGHKKTSDGKVLLNEKEVMQNALLNGDMERRCRFLGGIAESLDSIKYRTTKQEIIWEQ